MLTGVVQNDQLNEVLAATDFMIPPTDARGGEWEAKCHTDFLIEINATFPVHSNHVQQNYSELSTLRHT